MSDYFMPMPYRNTLSLLQISSWEKGERLNMMSRNSNVERGLAFRFSEWLTLDSKPHVRFGFRPIFAPNPASTNCVLAHVKKPGQPNQGSIKPDQVIPLASQGLSQTELKCASESNSFEREVAVALRMKSSVRSGHEVEGRKNGGWGHMKRRKGDSVNRDQERDSRRGKMESELGGEHGTTPLEGGHGIGEEEGK
ncbi:hypothetical protein B0H19DRAFT_1065500 [Mycena capillaripes]|nr:hypothetical protein B0H19DRAFT_1065500 [Mycena capillaripes]